MSARAVRVLGVSSALVVLVVLLATSAGVGVTWDEPIYSDAAERAARWFAVLLRQGVSVAFDPHAFGIGWGLVNEHPPMARILNGLGWAVAQHVVPVPTVHRLGSMALAAVTVGVIVSATARRRSLTAALFAGAAVPAMPRLFFHAHLAALDFPLACAWILATLIFYRAIGAARRWSPLWIGLGLGLALLTKINAVLLVPYWGLWLLLFRRSWRAWRTFLLGLPVALAVLIAGWPWIWKDPLAGLAQWVQFFRVHFDIRQWFAGRLYLDTPWYLPPAVVAMTVPLTLLLLAVAGAIWRGLRPQGQEDGLPDARPRGIIDDWTGLQLLGLLVVLGYYMLPITRVHDQDRLLLPAYLHLAILAGQGFAAFAGWIGAFLPGVLPSMPPKGARMARGALRVAVAALMLLPGIASITRLHPFELSYYNELVGGVAGAARLGMETTYFASTYGHFLPELNRLPAGSKLWVMPNSYDVIFYYQRYGLLRNDIVVLRPSGWGSFYDDQGAVWAVGELADADYALIDRRQTSFNAGLPGHAVQLEWAERKAELARLERDGILLAALYARQDALTVDPGDHQSEGGHTAGR